jgi:hypothetical protein
MAKAREESTKEQKVETQVEMPISTYISTLQASKEEKCQKCLKVEIEVDMPISMSTYFSAQSMTRRRPRVLGVI